jgi:hypothetical protein
VTFDESEERQGLAPGGLVKETYGVAHPNLFGQNYYAWRVRCQFAKDKIIPEVAVFSDGAGECQ